jgi:hypothetical protein
MLQEMKKVVTLNPMWEAERKVLFNPDGTFIVDKSVYSVNRALRMVGSYKDPTNPDDSPCRIYMHHTPLGPQPCEAVLEFSDFINTLASWPNESAVLLSPTFACPTKSDFACPTKSDFACKGEIKSSPMPNEFGSGKQGKGRKRKKEEASAPPANPTKSGEKKQRTRSKKYSPEQKQDAVTSLNLIPADCSYDKWSKASWYLKQIFNDEPDTGFRHFHEWSRTGTQKYKNEQDCQTTYQNQQPCKAKNPVACLKKLVANIKSELVDHKQFKSEWHMSLRVREQVKDVIKITQKSSGSNFSGYVYNPVHNLWEHKSGDDMATRIPNIVSDWLRDTKEAERELDEQEKRSIRKCYTVSGAKSIITFLRDSLYQPDFEDIINSAPTSLPISDGQIIELKTLEVRPRTKTDFWSDFLDVRFTLDADRTTEFQKTCQPLLFASKGCAKSPQSGARIHTDSTRLQAIESLYEQYFPDFMKFLRSIMHTPEERAFWRWNHAYAFTNLDRDRHGTINNGDTKGGKSTANGLMKRILKDGFLYVPIGESVLIDGHGGTQADHTRTDLLSLKGKRFAAYTESERRHRVSSKQWKVLISGGEDNLIARGLYEKKASSFVNHAKIHAFSNSGQLKMDTTDPAIVNRTRVICYKTRFVSQEEIDSNPYFESKLQPASVPNSVGEEKKDLAAFRVAEYKECVLDGDHSICQNADVCLIGIAAATRKRTLTVSQFQEDVDSKVYLLENSDFIHDLKTTHINQIFTALACSCWELLQLLPFYQDHIPCPKIITDQTRQYFDDQDVVCKFVKEAVEILEAYEGDTVRVLYRGFLLFLGQTGRKNWTEDTFETYLLHHNFKLKHSTKTCLVLKTVYRAPAPTVITKSSHFTS